MTAQSRKSLFTTRRLFFTVCVLITGIFSSASAGLIVSENYSTDAGFTSGFVQSTYSAMSGTYAGTPINGTGATLYEMFTPTSDYDLVSLEFRYEVSALGTTPNLNFNLYTIPSPPVATADNLVLGSALLGSGIDFTPTALASGITNMAVTFTDADVISLTNGNSYAIAITASDVTWEMRRRGGGNEAGGYGYKDLAPLNSGGRAYLISFYDTAVIPEPSSLFLLIGGFAVLGFFSKRRR